MTESYTCAPFAPACKIWRGNWFASVKCSQSHAIVEIFGDGRRDEILEFVNINVEWFYVAFLVPLPRSFAAVQRSLKSKVAKSDASSSDTLAPSVERFAMMICPSSMALPRSRKLRSDRT